MAIDDFSMGNTSLQYLQGAKFDIVKLDGKLVRAMERTASSEDIIRSIVYLSKSLGFTVTAEYVESEELRQKLEALGCSCYQGYLYGPAIPLDAFCALPAQIQK